MADSKQQLITQTKEIMIAGAFIFTGKPTSKMFAGKTVISLTYLDFGKPTPLFIDLEMAKKIEWFVPYCTPESVKKLEWMKVQFSTAIAPL